MDSQQCPPGSVSVVMTTFRSPNYLQQVLRGFANQTDTDFEIIVGEDGCTDETRQVVDRFAASTPIPIRYVTQVHDGFGKTRILNRAIEASGGDYLVFTDGDCVPRADFVATHRRLAVPNCFLSGGCIRLSRALTNRILTGSIEPQSFTDPAWLREQSAGISAKWLWIGACPAIAAPLDQLTTTRPTFNGHNASAWRSDVERVNGFNLQMRYGGLDRELGERLENAGVCGVQVRHRAVTYHLDHDRGYVNNEDWRRNHQIRQQVREQRVTFAEHGLREAPRRAG